MLSLGNCFFFYTDYLDIETISSTSSITGESEKSKGGFNVETVKVRYSYNQFL